MSQLSDFSFDDAEFVSNAVETAIEPTTVDRPEESPKSELAAPIIVIQQHAQRGLLVRLAPSAIILVIALVLVSFRRTEPVRYLVPRTSTQNIDSPKSSAPQLSRPDEKVVVRAGDAATIPNDGSTLPSRVERTNLNAVTDDKALAKVDAADETAYQNEVSPFEFPDQQAVSLNNKPLTRVVPFDLESKKTALAKQASAALKIKPAEGSKDLDPSLLAEVVKPAPKTVVVSNDDILGDIARAAEEKASEEKFLTNMKTEAHVLQLEAELDRSKNSRTSFREDLRKALNMPDDLAVAEIDRLCMQYGKDPSPNVINIYKRMVRFAPSRKMPQTDVDMMRVSGFPEITILLRLTESLKNTMKTRGGPRDEKELKIKAAKLLLTFPVKSERKATK